MTTASRVIVSPTDVAAATAPHLRGRWLALTRIGWGLGVLVEATVFLYSVPALFTLVHHPCSVVTGCMPAQLTLADFRKLGGQGPAINAYAVYVLVTVLAVTLVGATVGGLIAWRKWRDPMGLFVSLVLIATASGSVIFGASPSWNMATGSVHVPEVLARSGPVISVVGIAAEELYYPAFAIFLLTFPTGRFAPRWSALFVLFWIVQDVLFFVAAPFTIIAPCLLASTGSAAAIQIYRYVRRYTPVQRQQTKWVVFSFAFVALPLGSGYYVASLFWPTLNTPGSVYRLANIAVLLVSWMLISLGIGIAILRHQLYGIDVIIRRTLIYGSLTAILAGVYFGMVVGLQSLVTALTHQTKPQPVIIVASTLLIAMLANPLRRQVQAAIDRRFYRAKYDAARTLEGFAGTLRTETNLRELSEQLMAVAQETMQPVSVWLWLRESGKTPVDERTVGSD